MTRTTNQAEPGADTKKRPPARFIEGYSESMWKSLVVKSLRMGWPAGLRRASEVLSDSTMKALLICGVFEDIFPAESELAEVLDEINRRDYETLCARETHHRRGYTFNFCALGEEGMVASREEQERLRTMGRRYGIPFLPPRSLNCFYEWLTLKPIDKGNRRGVDKTPWTEMPAAIADSHTYEGRRKRQTMTVLSGHFENHQKLAERVAKGGLEWDPERSAWD